MTPPARKSPAPPPSPDVALRSAREAAARRRTPAPPAKGNEPSEADLAAAAAVVMPDSNPGLEGVSDADLPARGAGRLVAGGANDSIGNFMRYLHDLRRYPLLDPEEERRLARLVRQGNREAFDRLVRHNLRFVITIAKKYSTQGVLFEDLVSEGNLGLMRAVTKFDPDRGVKLVSYAAYWIEQAIRSALANQGRSVRLPANRTAELSKIRRATHALRSELGRTPTAAEIAAHTELTLSTVTLLLDVGPDVALDAPVHDGGEGGTQTWLDRLAAETPADAALESESRSQAIAGLLSTLKPRDATVLRLCFGINYAREHTLEEVGVILGISRERARQIRDRALREIMANPDLSLLKDFWSMRTPAASDD